MFKKSYVTTEYTELNIELGLSERIIVCNRTQKLYKFHKRYKFLYLFTLGSNNEKYKFTMSLEKALQILEEIKNIIPNEKYIELTKNIQESNKTIIIYKLICNVTGLVYIGKTELSLPARLAGHKNDYKRRLSGKIKNK